MTFKKIFIVSLILVFGLPTFAKDVTNKVEYMNFDWWNKYNDEVLVSHLHTLYENNHNLRAAAYKTKQAEENIRLATSSQLPKASIDAQLMRTMRGAQTEFGNVIIPQYSQNNIYLPLNASYEIDIWGENYLVRKSAKVQKEIAEQEERSAYIYITSSFVANYFNLIKFDTLENILNEIIDTQKQIVCMTEKKYDLGLASITELLNAKQILVKNEEELNRIIENKKVVNNQLVSMLGLNTDKDIEHASVENLTLQDVPEKLSATVIQYRPDLIESEKYAEKVGIDVRIAKRDFLPKFFLFGNLGFNAYRWNSVFNNTTFFSNIGIAPSWDIFSGGAKLAKFRINKYEYKKAGENYQQSVLNSVQEVNDALALAKMTKSNLVKSEEDFAIESHKYELAVKQFNIGDSSKLDEMQSKVNLLIAKEQHVSSMVNDAISSISLYNAVGGIDYTKQENL